MQRLSLHRSLNRSIRSFASITDALESARDTFLRGRVRAALYSHLDNTPLPTSLGLPLYSDQGQARRAQAQLAALNQMFAGEIKTLDRTIYWMQKIETASEISSWLVGGSLLFNASKQGGKVLLRSTTKAAAADAASLAEGAVDAAVVSGLRTAGVEEENIERLQHATQLISQLILWN